MTVSRTEERADLYQTARVLLSQMTSELASAFQPSGAQESSLVGMDTEGSESAPQFDRISILTTARRPELVQGQARGEAAGELCRVTYSVPTTPDGIPLGLFVEQDFRPGLGIGGAPREPIRLSALVAGLNCTYLDAATGEWSNEWVSQEKLPKAVRVELLMKPARKGSKPIMIASTANISILAGPVIEEGQQEEEPVEE